MLDDKIIDAIERALANGKAVEVRREYADRANQRGGKTLVVEVSRKVNTCVVDVPD